MHGRAAYRGAAFQCIRNDQNASGYICCITTHKHSVPRRVFLRRTVLAADITLLPGGLNATIRAAVGEPEKDDLKTGFIKLTDIAPLAIACDKGYFEDESL